MHINMSNKCVDDLVTQYGCLIVSCQALLSARAPEGCQGAKEKVCSLTRSLAHQRTVHLGETDLGETDLGVVM